TGTNTVAIRDDDLPSLTFDLSAQSVPENAAPGVVTGRISRNTSTSQPLTVRLSSDRSGALTVPATVTIPAGGTNVAFGLTTVDDAIVSGDRIVVLVATADGFSSVSRSIVVKENDTVALHLVLS